MALSTHKYHLAQHSLQIKQLIIITDDFGTAALVL